MTDFLKSEASLKNLYVTVSHLRGCISLIDRRMRTQLSAADEDGRGNNTGRVIESILGTWMSQNLSRDSDSLMLGLGSQRLRIARIKVLLLQVSKHYALLF